MEDSSLALGLQMEGARHDTEFGTRRHPEFRNNLKKKRALQL